MPQPLQSSKRRLPTSCTMLIEEIASVQAAARVKQTTMSDFIRAAAVRDARRVLKRAERAKAA
jgi:uncharacterized protein (DUF1778 family)